MDLNWLKTAQEATQLVSSLILALFAVCSALSLILGFLGAWWPWAKTAAPAVSRFGVTLHDLGERIGSLFGGGVGSSRGFTGVRLLAFVSVLGIATVVVGGCAGFWTDARQHAVEDDAACILLHSAELVVDGELTPEQEAKVAVTCSLNPADVHAFLFGHREQLHEHQAALASARKAGACR